MPGDEVITVDIIAQARLSRLFSFNQAQLWSVNQDITRLVQQKVRQAQVVVNKDNLPKTTAKLAELLGFEAISFMEQTHQSMEGFISAEMGESLTEWLDPPPRPRLVAHLCASDKGCAKLAQTAVKPQPLADVTNRHDIF